MRTLFFLAFVLVGRTAWSQDVRGVDFRNRVWPDTCLGSVRTRDGEFRGEVGARGWPRFMVGRPVYGDLDGDGADEAIVPTTCNGEGPSRLSNATVFGMRDGELRELARLGEGDRADGGLESIEIEGGVIVERRLVTQHGPTNVEFVANHRRVLREGAIVDLGAAALTCAEGFSPTCGRTLTRSRAVRFGRGRTDATRVLAFDTGGRLPELTLQLNAGQVLDIDAWCRGTTVAELRVQSPGGPVASDPSGSGRLRVHAVRSGAFQVSVRARQVAGYCYALLAAPPPEPTIRERREAIDDEDDAAVR